MNRVIWQKAELNKDKRWFEFWKPTWIMERYFLVVKNGYVCLGEKQEKGGATKEV